MEERPTLFAMVGLPGAGKTTQARQLEEHHQAIRLTPDEWMIPLLLDSRAEGRRDVLEGRFIAIARQALRARTTVILDFGLWSKDERSALRALAESCDARYELVYLPIDPGEQRRRLDGRLLSDPHRTFKISENELVEFARLFEAPKAAELALESLDQPPDAYTTWFEWMAERWPTSMA